MPPKYCESVGSQDGEDCSDSMGHIRFIRFGPLLGTPLRSTSESRADLSPECGVMSSTGLTRQSPLRGPLRAGNSRSQQVTTSVSGGTLLSSDQSTRRIPCQKDYCARPCTHKQFTASTAHQLKQRDFLSWFHVMVAADGSRMCDVRCGSPACPGTARKTLWSRTHWRMDRAV